MSKAEIPHIMDVLEKYVTTAALAGGYAIIGLLGARYLQQSKDEIDLFLYVFGWLGLGTIFALSFAVSIWAFLRAGKELEKWAGHSKRWFFVMMLIVTSLLSANTALWFHVDAQIGISP